MDKSTTFKKTMIAVVAIISVISVMLIYRKPTPPKHPHLPDISIETTAVLKDFLPNPGGDIDKLVYTALNEEHIIHFPPHTAYFITTQFKKGDTVELRAQQKPHGNHPLPELILIKKNDVLVDVKSIRPPAPGSANAVQLNFQKFSFQKDGNGQIIGIITDKYFIPVPPNLIRPSGIQPPEISVNGYLRDSAAGFVNIYRLKLLKPSSIIINNTNYIL